MQLFCDACQKNAELDVALFLFTACVCDVCCRGKARKRFITLSLPSASVNCKNAGYATVGDKRENAHRWSSQLPEGKEINARAAVGCRGGLAIFDRFVEPGNLSTRRQAVGPRRFDFGREPIRTFFGSSDGIFRTV